jgi:hypothetical protein
MATRRFVNLPGESVNSPVLICSFAAERERPSSFSDLIILRWSQGSSCDQRQEDYKTLVEYFPAECRSAHSPFDLPMELSA